MRGHLIVLCSIFFKRGNLIGAIQQGGGAIYQILRYLLFQSERRDAGLLSETNTDRTQRSAVEMEPNSTTVGTDMTTVSESIPLASTCSTCATTEMSRMSTETMCECTETTAGMSTETGMTTLTGTEDYETSRCQDTMTTEGKSPSTFKVQTFLYLFCSFLFHMIQQKRNKTQRFFLEK